MRRNRFGKARCMESRKNEREKKKANPQIWRKLKPGKGRERLG